ncbi:hypothetical protein KRR40_17650 [Niabella defluvii]|nr:hypothetical protein KRR40_17650 [Niabella sp. I65]
MECSAGYGFQRQWFHELFRARYKFRRINGAHPRNFDSGNWNNRNGNVRIYGAPALGIHRTGPKLGIKVQDVEKTRV